LANWVKIFSTKFVPLIFHKIDYNLDYYTDVQDLSFLQRVLDKDKVTSKYKKLNAALSEVIEDFGLVSFTTLNIEDKESVMKLLKIVDKSKWVHFFRTAN